MEYDNKKFKSIFNIIRIQMIKLQIYALWY